MLLRQIAEPDVYESYNEPRGERNGNFEPKNELFLSPFIVFESFVE